MRVLLTTLAALGLAMGSAAAADPQQQFFDNLRSLCGQAYEGEITDGGGDPNFAGRLVMHVRECSDDQIKVPFHVGDNRSRTWVITRTDNGLELKHDHRKEDGSDDVITMYGGHTAEPGWAQVQAFPVDEYSQDLFVREGLAVSVTNTWWLWLYPDEHFSYRLSRENRNFVVRFDLTEPVEPPPAPWGHKSRDD